MATTSAARASRDNAVLRIMHLLDGYTTEIVGGLEGGANCPSPNIRLSRTRLGAAEHWPFSQWHGSCSQGMACFQAQKTGKKARPSPHPDEIANSRPALVNSKHGRGGMCER